MHRQTMFEHHCSEAAAGVSSLLRCPHPALACDKGISKIYCSMQIEWYAGDNEFAKQTGIKVNTSFMLARRDLCGEGRGEQPWQTSGLAALRPAPAGGPKNRA